MLPIITLAKNNKRYFEKTFCETKKYINKVLFNLNIICEDFLLE